MPPSFWGDCFGWCVAWAVVLAVIYLVWRCVQTRCPLCGSQWTALDRIHQDGRETYYCGGCERMFDSPAEPDH